MNYYTSPLETAFIIQHYGVLGMKWGVRRTPEQLGRHVIPKGIKMYRATTNPDERDKVGSIYVTYLAPDRDMYRGAWANNIRNNTGKTQLYESSYILNEDLVIPGRDELKEIQREVLKDINLRTEVAVARAKQIMDGPFGQRVISRAYYNEKYTTLEDKKANAMREYNEEGKKIAEDFLSNYGNDNIKDFNRSMAALGTATHTKEAMIKALQKRGYNAMVDEASVGSEVDKFREGVEPLIVFDSDSSLNYKNTRQVSKNEEKAATARYMDWFDKANRNRYKGPW